MRSARWFSYSLRTLTLWPHELRSVFSGRRQRRDAISAPLFRAVERLVGAAQQLVAGLRFRLRVAGDADAHGDVQRPAARVDRRLVEGASASLGHRFAAGEIGLRKERHELFAPPSREEIGRAQAPRERVRRRHDDAIADQVTEAIVDLLEVIEIEDHEGERRAVALRAFELPRENIEKMPAI